MQVSRPLTAALVLIALLGVVVGIAIDPISRDDSHYWRAWIAAFSVVMLGIHALLQWRGGRRARGVWTGAAVFVTVLSVFNYYQFDPKVARSLGDYTDITYYYVNSKYLDEIGYFELYPAMLIADREFKNRHASNIKKYRDLHTYEERPAKDAFAQTEAIKARFSPERWEQFKADTDFFLSRKSLTDLQSNFFVDHGYNPPPTWTIVGGSMARVVPTDGLKLIASADIGLVAAMFAGIWWAFGFDVMLLAALFFFTTFSGRWPILGQALMRFDWLTMLVLGLCFLKRDRPALAGASMAYAALNRIFPAIFFLGWMCWAAWSWWRRRQGEPDPEPGRRLLLPQQWRFIAGAALLSTTLIGAALVSYGPGVFVDSAANLQMHNSPDSYSSHRVGLGDALVYRGETTRPEINQNGGIPGKARQIEAMMPMLKVAGLGTMAFVFWYAGRTRRAVWDLTHLGILPLYCLTNPQINYYNLRLLPVLWHAAHLRDHPYHRIALAWLFAIEIVAHATKVAGYERYTTTSLTSLGLGAYVLAMIAFLLWEQRQEKRGPAEAVSG